MTANAIALPRSTFATTMRAYISLTKPMIILMLLVTTVPAMILAAGGWPGNWLVVATLIGGTLSAAGANTINCWYDRDIDAVMRRTRSRPLVTGAIAPGNALAFGVLLGGGAFVFLAITTTLAAAALSLAALLFYVFVYTIWLKRRTPQNIVIGGAAGAFPPMVGWAAVTGDITWASFAMFVLIFMWTPPHFWALALRLKGDYAEAGVPMLPVVSGVETTRTQILIYSVLLLPVCGWLAWAGDLSWIFTGTAAITGAVFVMMALRLWRDPDHTPPINLYLYSLLYLALVFAAIGVDVAILA